MYIKKINKSKKKDSKEFLCTLSLVCYVYTWTLNKTYRDKTLMLSSVYNKN